MTGDVTPVIELSEELLRPRGGPLFDGYKSFCAAGVEEPI